jgi:hypothetical protein
MSDDTWFSATLRFVWVNSALGQVRAEESVFLAKASDFGEALRKFLQIGRQKETAYKNYLGELIKKRFSEIKTLDIIASCDLDGAEIQSTPIFESDPTMTMDGLLDPGSSKPTPSI